GRGIDFYSSYLRHLLEFIQVHFWTKQTFCLAKNCAYDIGFFNESIDVEAELNVILDNSLIRQIIILLIFDQLFFITVRYKCLFLVPYVNPQMHTQTDLLRFLSCLL